MHGVEEFSHKDDNTPGDGRPWYKLLTKYHWFVLIVAALGWLFDCLDQQLFILARPAAMKELIPDMPVVETDPDAKPEPGIIAFAARCIRSVGTNRQIAGDVSTSIFIAGWATGGLIFGMLGDRIGRAKTMLMTILIYSACTGLSAFSVSVWDFAFYRFLTGLGVGGEFAVGVALVAEVMPGKARPYALSMLQALSAFGNISAAFINMGLGLAEGEGLVSSPWRVMFMIGALPALLALFIRSNLKEPEQWEKASHDGKIAQQLGSYTELFAHPTWRKHAIWGLVLACSGVIGLWAIGFYIPDLYRAVQTREVSRMMLDRELAAAKASSNTDHLASLTQLQTLMKEKAEIPDQLKDVKKDLDKKISGALTYWQSFPSIALNVGAFFGMFGFGAVAQRIGRKPTFAIALIAAGISTLCTCYFLNELWQVFVLVPIMGFCQLSLFAGYAIYFPELFPTRLRSTGTSFCYNVGRFVAALGPLIKTAITQTFFSSPTLDEGTRLRYAGMSMCAVFLVGLIALPFLPETKGKQLPE